MQSLTIFYYALPKSAKVLPIEAIGEKLSMVKRFVY